MVAVGILKEWRNQDPLGRFIVVAEGSTLWKDVGDKAARAYISKILKHPDAFTANDNASENHETSLDSATRRRPLHASVSSSNDLDWSHLASKFYEREDHVAKLWQAFGRSLTTNQAELVLTCGPSGSGKSELARSMKDFASNNNGFLLWGKLEELRHKDKTYSAFFFSNENSLNSWNGRIWHG